MIQLNRLVAGAVCVIIVGMAAGCRTTPTQTGHYQHLPSPGSVVVDHAKKELILSATIQFPEGKLCINEFGQRVQAFAGCATAAGGDASMAEYFVFLVDVETETVFDGLMSLGCRPEVHCSMEEGRKRSGTRPGDAR